MNSLTLPRHNRYDYSPITERKDYSWPGGKRLAFCLTTNITCFAFGKGRACVFGQPFRLRPLRTALKHCLANNFMDRVWKARPGEIADYCYAMQPGIIPGS